MRFGGLAIDTVVCLTLAKWETVSGQFISGSSSPVRYGAYNCGAAPYQEARLFGSAVVSLTTSHRSKTQALLNALASECRNTTVSSGRKETTKSSPSCRRYFRLRGRLITPMRSDMEAPPLADMRFA
jgi:hypothetical protein